MNANIIILFKDIIMDTELFEYTTGSGYSTIGWIDFVREYLNDNPHLSWKEALSAAAPLYHKLTGTKRTTKKKSKSKKGKSKKKPKLRRSKSMKAGGCCQCCKGYKCKAMGGMSKDLRPRKKLGGKKKKVDNRIINRLCKL